jgi:hypothetical protein
MLTAKTSPNFPMEIPMDSLWVILVEQPVAPLTSHPPSTKWVKHGTKHSVWPMRMATGNRTDWKWVIRAVSGHLDRYLNSQQVYPIQTRLHP